LLLSDKGILKLCDFGLARHFTDSTGHYTNLVVTLWYRAPELLLGAQEYTPAIDIWSVGCFFAELLNSRPLLPGKTELDQLDKIFKLFGTPNTGDWPSFTKLPFYKTVAPTKPIPPKDLNEVLPRCTLLGRDLFSALTACNPDKRMTASDALKHPYFEELPLAVDPLFMPTWPPRTMKSTSSKNFDSFKDL